MAERTLGQIAYEAYGKSTGWLTHDGRRMPAWDDLTDAVREAWHCAVEAVVPAVGMVGDHAGAGLVVNGDNVCLNGVRPEKLRPIVWAINGAISRGRPEMLRNAGYGTAVITVREGEPE